MENLVPLGTGNSRLMKSNIPSNTTLAQLIQMWNNGTFPYDIGPLNSAGISQQGTPLNKDTLLKDTTAALYGLDSDAVPDDVLSKLSGAAISQGDVTPDKVAFQDWSNIDPFPSGVSTSTGLTWFLNGKLYHQYTNGSNKYICWYENGEWSYSQTAFSSNYSLIDLIEHNGTLYLNVKQGTYYYIWYSTDGGSTFTQFISTDFGGSDYTIQGIAIANNNLIVAEYARNEDDYITTRIRRIDLTTKSVVASGVIDNENQCGYMPNGSLVVYQSGYYYIPVWMDYIDRYGILRWNGASSSSLSYITLTSTQSGYTVVPALFEIDGQIGCFLNNASSTWNQANAIGWVSNDITSVTPFYSWSSSEFGFISIPAGSPIYGVIFKAGDSVYFISSLRIIKSTNSDYSQFEQVGQAPSSNSNTLIFPVNSNLFYCVNGGTTDLYTESTFVVLSYLYDVLGNKLTLQADQISGGIRIATGSYVGTGTYGASNPNTLTFDFQPELVFVQDSRDNATIYNAWFLRGCGCAGGIAFNRSTDNNSVVGRAQMQTFDGNTLSWYNYGATNAQSQLNANGITYRYVALG